MDRGLCIFRLGFRGSEALLEMTSDGSVWRGSTQERRLSEAYSEFARMCKAEHVRLLDGGMLKISSVWCIYGLASTDHGPETFD